MKMWKCPTWQRETTGTEGNAVLFGVSIFKYPWKDCKKNIHINGRIAAVYSVMIDGQQYEFATTEVSNGVWEFYTFHY